VIKAHSAQIRREWNRIEEKRTGQIRMEQNRIEKIRTHQNGTEQNIKDPNGTE
jgi:hypothetical protein